MTQYHKEQNYYANTPLYTKVIYENAKNLAASAKFPQANDNLTDQEKFNLFIQQRQIIMTFLFVNYIFLSDDGEIDKKEVKTIEKLFKVQPKILDEEQINEILEINKSRVTIEQVKTYFSVHNIKEDSFKETFFGLNKVIKSNKRYLQALKDIKNTFYNQ